MATKSASSIRSNRNSNRLSKTDRELLELLSDRELLELLGRFCIRAKHSTWETVNHNNEIEAVALFREVSQYLTTSEYELLTNGWSDYRLYSDDATLNHAVESITQRLQERVESF